MTNKPTITIEFKTLGHLYWFDIDRGEPIETATDETLARAGYVPTADLACATGHVAILEHDLREAVQRGDTFRDQCVSIGAERNEAESRATAAEKELHALKLDNDKVGQEERELRAALNGDVERARANESMAKSAKERAERELGMARAIAESACIREGNVNARFAALETAALHICRTSSTEEWLALSAALDALTPSAAAVKGEHPRATCSMCGCMMSLPALPGIVNMCAECAAPSKPTPSAPKPATCSDCVKRNPNNGMCSEFSVPTRASAGMCNHFTRRLPVVVETCGYCKERDINYECQGICDNRFTVRDDGAPACERFAIRENKEAAQ